MGKGVSVIEFSMAVRTDAGRDVVSAPAGRLTILIAVGFGALFATAFLILYVVWPEKMGPSEEHPNANSLRDVVVLFAGAWALTGFLWALIDREVSVHGDQILVTRGTGRKTVLRRADVKAIHAFPIKNWYLIWLSCNRAAPIGRSIFFSRSPTLPWSAR